MILAHFLRHDRDVSPIIFLTDTDDCLHSIHQALLRTIRSWPHDIYDIGAVILAIQGQIDRQSDSAVLIEAIAEL